MLNIWIDQEFDEELQSMTVPRTEPAYADNNLRSKADVEVS